MPSCALSYRRLKKICQERGALLFGVADIDSLKGEFEFSGQVIEGLNRAVCLGVALSDPVLSEIITEPTKIYYHHYRTANMFLDQLSFFVHQWILGQGFKSLPVAASQITDWRFQRAHLSHKKVAVKAGLGWIGRNNLLVTKRFGSRIRLSTILTDMPLPPDQAQDFGCADCFLCVESCPVGAIKKNPVDFDHEGCFEKLKSFQKQNIVGQYICGICVNACSPRPDKEVKKAKKASGHRRRGQAQRSAGSF